MPPSSFTPEGQHEVAPERFARDAAAGFVHSVDLKALLPELFAGTNRMPRVLEGVWRAACDEVLATAPGFYTCRGARIDVCFSGLPEAAGKNKITVISLRIHELLRAASVAPSERKNLIHTDAQEMPSDLARLIREGLCENPSAALVRLWSARVMHDMLHSTKKVPLLKDMLDIVAKTRISYAPFWDSETGMTGGALVRVAGAAPPDKCNTGEAMRQDLAVLFAAVVQILYLQSQGKEAALIIPVRAATIADAAVADLYQTFLRRLAPGVGSSIIMTISGLPSANVPLAVSEGINAVADGVRSFMFETAAEDLSGYRRAFPVLHGLCVDAGGGGVTEALLHRYAQRCRRQELKMCVRGIADVHLLEAAHAAGYTYISGPAFAPLLDRACAAGADISG